jgi:L-ribulose-5-phosphate 4-epimerase
MLEALKKQVWQANLDLVKEGLVVQTWGNVSGLDRAGGKMVIKPSGVPYEGMAWGQMAVVSLATGRVVEGRLRPSSDTPTHLALYRAFGEIGGIAHTHSPYATMFAQAGRGIPCLGTTHADHFNGEVPVTRAMTRAEVAGGYEENTGSVIVERFRKLNAAEMPAVLVAHHGPFTWGKNAAEALTNSVALELVAQTALGTLQLAGSVGPIPAFLLAKHFCRKHGPNAYYGQKR